MSDDESVLGELETAGSAMWGAVSSAGDAMLNTEEAGLHAIAGVGETAAGGIVGMVAGGAYALQEDDAAASLRGTSNSVLDSAVGQFESAGQDLSTAGQDLWGADVDGGQIDPSM